MIRTMRRTKNRSVKQDIILNAQSYNKVLPKAYLQGLSTTNLLRLTHPLDREDFARTCQRDGLISEATMKLFVKRI